MANSSLQFTPAHFPKTEDSLLRKIKFPSVEGNIDVTLLCNAMISRRSKIQNHNCFSTVVSKHTKHFLKAVERASRVGTIVGAKVSGTPVRAMFSYRVRFHKDGSDRKITSFPNHGFDVEKYGNSYSQAQQFANGHRGQSGCSSLKAMLISIQIDESGKPVDVSILKSKGASDRCKQSYIDDFSQDSYIPAMLNGKALTSKHIISIYFDSSSRFTSKRDWNRVIEPDKT